MIAISFFRFVSFCGLEFSFHLRCAYCLVVDYKKRMELDPFGRVWVRFVSLQYLSAYRLLKYCLVFLMHPVDFSNRQDCNLQMLFSFIVSIYRSVNFILHKSIYKKRKRTPHIISYT